MNLQKPEIRNQKPEFFVVEAGAFRPTGLEAFWLLTSDFWLLGSPAASP